MFQINNAGVTGGKVDPDGIRAATSGAQVNWKEIVYQNYELMEEGLQINYYGAKKMVEAFVPLLQLSQSPRIVNVSSSMGKLKVLCKLTLSIRIYYIILYQNIYLN